MPRLLNEEQRRKASLRASKWAKDNPERAKAYRSAYYAQNKEKIAARQKAYSSAHKDQSRAKVYAFWKAKPWYRAWINAKQRCENKNDASFRWYGAKGIKCSLSEEDLKTLWFSNNAASLKQPSLDRLDTSKDYTVDNCRFIEKYDNMMEGLSKSWAKRRAAKEAREANDKLSPIVTIA